MDKKTHSNRAHKIDTRGVKRLVFILAVSSTLSFWALFSNKMNVDLSAAAGSKVQALGAVPPAQAENQFVLDLPPMPTLIPPLDPSKASLELPPITVQNPVGFSRPSVPMTGKIFLGGEKPKLGVSAPITTTRSSR
jgi:hypothetical protein